MDEESPRICSHTFTLPEYDYEGYDAESSRWLMDSSYPGVRDGAWHCPHRAVDGESMCPFHLPVDRRPEELDETESFLEIIEGRTERGVYPRHTQFVDATFTGLKLDERTIRAVDNRVIDCSHATIGGIRGEYAEFVGRFKCANGTFTGPIECAHATFEKRVDLRGATFLDEVEFKGSTFEDYLGLKQSTFRERADFYYTTFEFYLSGGGVTFERDVRFEAAYFDYYLRLVDATFEGAVNFRLATFDDEVGLSGATFAEAGTFEEARFRRLLAIEDLTINGRFELENADVDRITLEIAPDQPADTVVSLAGSNVRAGTVRIPADGTVAVDLDRTTVGSVKFTAIDGGSVLEYVRFLRTTYDGFEFEDDDDVDPERTNWTIHTLENEDVLPREDRIDPTPTTLRQTYLNAKNGADDVGNNTAAGAFFYRELVYRRRSHFERARDGSLSPLRRVRALTKWARNGVLAVTAGYGERADRVIYSSLAVIGLFAVLYSLVIQPLDQDASVVDYTTFSAQVFVTFIVGSPPTNTSTLGEAIVVAQGFIGAFLIALFVFTFTRRVYR